MFERLDKNFKNVPIPTHNSLNQSIFGSSYSRDLDPFPVILLPSDSRQKFKSINEKVIKPMLDPFENISEEQNQSSRKSGNSFKELE